MIGEETAVSDNQTEYRSLFTARHLLVPSRGEPERIEDADQEQNEPPPNTGMQVFEYNVLLRRMRQTIDSGGGNHNSISQQQDTDEKPNRDKSFAFDHGQVTRK